jgi:Nucleotidyltransferase domain.
MNSGPHEGDDRFQYPDLFKCCRYAEISFGRRKQFMKDRTVDPFILEKIVQRIVTCAHPEKIILFGSGARGNMGPDSDIDLLVIKEGEFDAGAITDEIYMNLIGIGQAVDVVVVSAVDAERYRDSPYFIVYPALLEGREVYHAEPVST